MTTPAGTPARKVAIWARVSTEEQENENQLYELRGWAERRGLEVAQEFITEDSAWATGKNGNSAKGKRFDAARGALLNGARLGHYSVVLIWALDRLSRRGMEDTLAIVRQLREYDCLVWSLKEPALEDLRDPRALDLVLGLSGWTSEGESGRRSERIQAGMARVKREIEAALAEGRNPGKRIGGRKPGSRDRRRRRPEGYEESWQPGGKLYEARQQRLAAEKEALLADPERLHALHRDVECERCGAQVGDPCRVPKGRRKGKATETHSARMGASLLARSEQEA